ncbi:MAG TPA: SDR family oxidoreductase [Pyrinomonadaceae bacterium]|nr:SDR family oxidoreductase [Pyrinomonadaceae bacterium]
MDAKEFGRRWRLDGRRAVVTGATKGIGRAVAEELCGLGAEVLIAARDPEGVGRAVEEMRAAGHRAHGVAADVGTSEGRRLVLAGAESLLGGADILVNNAGTNIRKRALDYTEDEYEFLLRTNMTSAFELSRMFHPSLKEGGAGSVVNVVSVAGLVSVGTGVVYAMTKAALIQMTRSLAAEWGPDGVRVNAVAPWFTRTPLTEPVLGRDEFRARVVARTPLGRVAEPEEVSGVVAFLCLPVASYVTGQCVAPDGGFLAHGL